MNKCIQAWILIGLAVSARSSFGQPVAAPVEAWQQSYGSPSCERLSQLAATSDGGFVLGGYHNGCVVTSCEGNRESGGFGDDDYWLVRIDGLGNRLWDRSYGGTGLDQMESVAAGRDGGFILGGWSDSDVSGNKTAAPIGALDFWVIRLNEDGSIRWQQTYGGPGFDVLLEVVETQDGGVILGGTVDNPFTGDPADSGLWIVRTDDQGETLWERLIPCAQPALGGVVETAEGGVMIGWQCGLPTGFQGAQLTKLDANGATIWDRPVTSARVEVSAFEPVPTGGFILGGTLLGDATVSRFWYWALRLDDEAQPIWERTFHGVDGADVLTSILPTSGGGLVLGGQSDSEVGDDKTSPGFGNNDYWLVRVGANGDKLWDLSYGSSGTDSLTALGITAEGGFLVGGHSNEDQPENPDDNKTSVFWGCDDPWVIRLGPDGGDNGGGGEDDDGDGVSNDVDQCPDTLPGAVTDSAGCSIEQLVPCEGPWNNHGDYMSRLVKVTARLVAEGRLTHEERAVMLRQGAQSGCGQ